MTLREAILAIHIVAGSAGLILGPVAMLAPKRRGRHPRVGEIYHWVMLMVCLSAVAMALLAFRRIWWFLPIATFSYANALVGFLAARRRRAGWLPVHIGGMCGSYIALVTALLVVNFGTTTPIAWAFPTLVGTPLIIRARRRWGARPRPTHAYAPSWAGATETLTQGLPPILEPITEPAATDHTCPRSRFSPQG